MLWQVLLVESLWFWLLIGAGLIWILFSVARDWGTGATMCLITLAVVMTLFTDFNPFKWVYYHPLHTIIVGVLYFAAGFLWALIKWRSVMLHIKDVYQQLLCYWNGHIADGKMPAGRFGGYCKDFAEYVSVNENEFVMSGVRIGRFQTTDIKTLFPKVNDNKNVITFWITYWPFGLTWALTHDLWGKIARFLVDQYRVIFESISKNILGNLAVPSILKVDSVTGKIIDEDKQNVS